MLDSVGKLLEKAIDTRLKDIYEQRGMLTNNQYGFRRSRSTIDAISRVMGIVRRGLDSTCMVAVLTLDIKNAFNSAPWCTIMNSLEAKRVPGYICRLLDDYFSERVLLYGEYGTENSSRKVTAGLCSRTHIVELSLRRASAVADP